MNRIRPWPMPYAILAVVAVCAAAFCCDRKGQTPMSISLKSSAFADGQPIPAQYTADGKDISPPLSWSGLPERTKELALILDDPDAPSREPWVHWVIYKIPADAPGLTEAVPRKEKLDSPLGALQGVNSWPRDNVGYRGPAPPSGVHHYQFRLYALDGPLDLKGGLTKKALLDAMNGHVLGAGLLVGTYQRPSSP